jgi:hypothetical protein
LWQKFWETQYLGPRFIDTPSNDNMIVPGGTTIVDTVTAARPQAATNFPLPLADLDSLGFRRQQVDRLIALIERHIAEGRYPGCADRARPARQARAL